MSCSFTQGHPGTAKEKPCLIWEERCATRQGRLTPTHLIGGLPCGKYRGQSQRPAITSRLRWSSWALPVQPHEDQDREYRHQNEIDNRLHVENSLTCVTNPLVSATDALRMNDRLLPQRAASFALRNKPSPQKERKVRCSVACFCGLMTEPT